MEIIEVDGLLRRPDQGMEADDNIIRSYKGRTIDTSKPMRVYMNLHKKCYSIKQFGIVVAHADRLCVRDVKFVVNERQRQQVLITKQKNVHAYIEGYFSTSGMGVTAKRNDLPVEVFYNPYKYDSFVSDSLTIHIQRIEGAWFVIADEKGVKASYTH